MATIQTTPTRSTQPLVGLFEMPSAPKSRNRYSLATCARLAMTRMSATTIPQPPHHPVFGPKARVPHVNVVPQSGSALFNALYPYEMNSMGTKAMIVMIGACNPLMAMTTKPSVAARL